MTTRCLLADDHPALCAAVSAFLEDAGFKIVGPVSDGMRAVAIAERDKPDVAVVDFRMPRLSGVQLIQELRSVAPSTALVVYTADADEQMARQCLDAGASAVVLKEAPLADLSRALDAALVGRPYLDPAIQSQGAGRLTDRERDVLALLAEGYQHEEIGARLGISAETVRTHLRKASDRLGASTRTQAVATALRLGLIS